tara:strand:- start:3986 stop:5224 length:1239 start_codon:yes stop_codon:yes gene_type:complete
MSNPQSQLENGKSPKNIVYLISRICRIFILRRLKFLNHAIEICDPWKTFTVGKGSPVANIKISDPLFYQIVFQKGSLGIARSWIDNGWDTSDLTHVMKIFIRNQKVGDTFNHGISRLAGSLAFKRHKQRANTLSGSKRNIYKHYDLGNDFFALILDKTMAYSSGFFETTESTLEDASISKMERISQMLDLNSEDHLLDVGCGWGSFAIHAASRYGCKVTGITISSEQYQLASKRVELEGLSDLIEIQLCDYRNAKGKFSKLVSIEMIEAVGHEYLPQFFKTISDLLEPNGKIVLQAIVMPNERYSQYLHNSDFIQEYIFPGGCLLSKNVIEENVSKHTSLEIIGVTSIGKHYPSTLRHWRKNFWENKEKIKSLGYQKDFIRIWHYYFCYCEAGFEEKYLDNFQILLKKTNST